MSNLKIEQQARDFIAKHFEDFVSLITNYESFGIELEKERQSIFINEKFSLGDLLRLLIIEKLIIAVPVLGNLKILGIEFQLLKTTSKRGKQPSVDIMAYDPHSATLTLIELKISDSAEREALTELGAYSQGLQNRYNGLSNLHILWLPVSTHWRTTTKSSLAYFLAWQKKLALPLQMELDIDSGIVRNLSLKLFNPVSEISEMDALSLFSYECFDAFDYCTMKEIKNRPAFINYITSLCNNYNINGFVIFHKPVDMMFQYGFTLCMYNPYNGNIHKHISNYIVNEFGKEDYHEALKDSGILNTNYSDVDLVKDKLLFWDMEPFLDENGTLSCDAFWKKEDFIPVSDLADAEDDTNTRFLINHLKSAIDGVGENRRAFGTPNFKGTIDKLKISDVDAISYFGLHHELVSRHVSIELKQKKIDTDFFDTISSYSYLKKILKKYNS